MTNPNELQSMIGQPVVDNDGDKIGKIGQVYLDDSSGQPIWVTVQTGMFGNKESFAPLYGSSSDGDSLQLAVSKQLVKDAPNVDNDGHLEDAENDALYQHYAGYLGSGGGGQQVDYAEGDVQRGQANYAEQTGQTGVQGRDATAPAADDAMTRSEERLHVGTEQVETGRARLRKYIVEENVSTTVPVSHEEVRVEREPITDANAGDALSGAELSEEEHEVTLHAERPVVQKETVPVERVRLSTETVTEEQQVNETVRKEQIEQVAGEDVDTARRDR